MSSSNIVDHTTPLYRAYHEAGHCAAAFLTGANVDSIEVFPEGGGVCRVLRADDAAQRQTIAAAGYAIEVILHRSGRLAPQGPKTPDKWFIDFSMGNARDDKVSFFGGDFTEGDGAWPEEKDREFMMFGWREVSTLLASWMPAIEMLANRLAADSRVTGLEARAIFEQHGLPK